MKTFCTMFSIFCKSKVVLKNNLFEKLQFKKISSCFGMQTYKVKTWGRWDPQDAFKSDGTNDKVSQCPYLGSFGVFFLNNFEWLKSPNEKLKKISD